MDIFELPLELIEKIFLSLDTQALATCALADTRFSETIYSSHFLDEYCRISFDCNVITAADVCNANVTMPFEFWYWVYTTMKLDENDQDHIVFHSKYLTKIATLKNMYIMWLVCGMRSNHLFSHALLYELYPLPFTVKEAFDMSDHPGTLVNDVLTKAFLALPGIMDLTCSSSVEFFAMQKGGNTSLEMDLVCNDGIHPRLPIGFNPLFSVEIITAPMFGRSPAFLLLISEDQWVIWIGYLNVNPDNNDTTIGETCVSKYFSHSDKITDIRFHAQNAIQEVNSFVYSLRESMSCPIISYSSPETISITISLAQQHHSSLCQTFGYALYEHCSRLINTITSKYCDGSAESEERIVDILNYSKICENVQVNNYVTNLLRIKGKDVRTLNKTQQCLASIVIKNVIERIASLYRNEIHFCIENSFCHSFLCGCVDYLDRIIFSADEFEEKIGKCLSENMKDNVYIPNMWPTHILSAACGLVPFLVEVLESDVHMILSKGLKYVIPSHIQKKLNDYLKNAGLVLTQRPPTKPRCPPLFRQVRLWSIESLS